MLFYAVTAILLYHFLIGLFWPSRGTIDVYSWLITVAAKAFWLSWVIVFVSFELKIGDLSRPLIVGLILAMLAGYAMRRSYISHITFRWADFALMALGLVAILLSPGAAVLLNGDTVLSGWDVNLSWNNWASQLYRGVFHPYNAAYPIFLPGLWSLIYKAQGDPWLWTLPRIALFVFPIVLVLQICLLARAKLYLATTVAALSVFFVVLHFEHLFSGLADPILMMLILSAGLALFTALSADQSLGRETARVQALACAMFAGIAAITKQPGMFALVPALAGLERLRLLWRESYSWAFKHSMLALLPVAAFLIMFYPSKGHFAGTLPHLENLVTGMADGRSVYVLGWFRIETIAGTLTTIMLATFAMMNVFWLRRPTSQVGLLYLLSAVIGFIIFSKCCSYDERNGLFVVAFLILAAIFGTSPIEANVRNELMRAARWSRLTAFSVQIGAIRRIHHVNTSITSLVLIGIGLAAAGSLQFIVGTERYVQSATEQRARIVYPTVNAIILEASRRWPDAKIIGSYPFMNLLPGIETRTIECVDFVCALDALATVPTGVLLFSKGELGYAEISTALGKQYEHSSESEQGYSITRALTMADIPNSVLEKRDQLIASAKECLTPSKSLPRLAAIYCQPIPKR